MVVEIVERTIKEHNLILPGNSIVVGVSGGADSVCLLHVLNLLSPKFDIAIHVVHINHMLRGDEALQDEQYVRELCSCLGLPLTVKRFDINAVSKKLAVSIEVAGRTVRYREMEQVADSINASNIAVAHNMDDRAETIFMNIIRGTGLDGLKGIPYKRDRIIRPLLDVRRYQIEEYLRQKGIRPRTDSSNLKDIYTRNKIRLNFIPEIDKSFGVDIIASLLKMSEIVSEDNDFIDNYSKKLYAECVKMKKGDLLILDISKLKACHSAVQKRIIRMAIEEIKGDIKDIGRVHIEYILELAFFGSTGSKIHLPKGVRAEKSYEDIIIYLNRIPGNISFCYKVKIPGITKVEAAASMLKAEVEPVSDSIEKYKLKERDPLIQFFDYDRIFGEIYIRTRKNGDVFMPLKSPGTKKLKDFFIDKKIPRVKRDMIPLVASDNEIIWVIGHKISDKFKVTENTKNILKLEYMDE